MTHTKPKKTKGPSPVLWTTISIVFSLLLTAGTVYVFKSGMLKPSPSVPKRIVIADAEAVPRFNGLMDAANAAIAAKDYLAAVTTLDQILALAESNARVKQACEEQEISSQREKIFKRASRLAKVK